MAIRTFGNIEYLKEDNEWSIYGCQPHVSIKLKKLFEKIPKAATTYKFNNIPEVCFELKWFMERYPLAIRASDLILLQDQANRYVKTMQELENIMLPGYQPSLQSLDEILKDTCQPRQYQSVGRAVAQKAKRILIGDDVGLGKTLTGILSIATNLPAIIVVQTHLPKQWAAQIEKFTKLKPYVIKGTKVYNLPPADVYIIKYSCLFGWVNIFEQCFFTSAVFDEVQEMRTGPGTSKYNAASILSENVNMCLGLSATPIYNYVDEIFNVIDLIKPGAVGDRESFIREWTGLQYVPYTVKRLKLADPKALGAYLREQFLFLRRTRKEVGRELPPVNTIFHTVGYDSEEVKKAEDIARVLASKVFDGDFMQRGQAAMELDMLARKITGVSKAREVAEFVKILLENDEPVLLAGWHRDVYAIWQETLAEYNPVFYTGSETETQKNLSKEAFIKGDTNLLIMSLRSGIGVDGLQHRCKTIVYGELDYSPQVHKQFTGRVARDGQEDTVSAFYLVSEYGSDPGIMDVLAIKSSQQQGIINPYEEPLEQYTDNDRIRKLAMWYLKKKN